MQTEVDIKAFKKWASQLGMPIQKKPTDDVLKLVFKSRQNEIIYNLMKKVKPRSQTHILRRHNLLVKAGHLDKQFPGTVTSSFLPKEIQICSEAENLNARKVHLKQNTLEMKNKSESVLSSVKRKNLYKIQLQHKQAATKAKANIFELKIDSLNIRIKKEENCQKQITLSSPIIKKSSSLSNGLKAKTILERMEITLCDSSDTGLNDDEGSIWGSLKKMFIEISNWEVWEIILNASSGLSKKIIELTRTECQDKNEALEQFTPFERAISNMQTASLNVIFKCLAEYDEAAILSNNFIGAHERFVNALNLQQTSYNIETVNLEETVSNFIEKASTQLFNQEQINNLQKEINSCKAQLFISSQNLETHQVLLTKTRKMYDEIAALATKIFQDFTSLGHTKQKTVYSKRVMQYMLNTTLSQKKKGMKIGDLTDSFEISNVLCSTKVDLENSFANTTLRSDTTTLNSKINQNQYFTEIITFIDLSPVVLKVCPNESNIYIAKNQLLSNHMEPSFILQMLPGCLLTTHGSKEEIKSKLNWCSEFKTRLMDEAKSMGWFEAYENKFKKNNMKEEKLAELLDVTNAIALNSVKKLRKLDKCYEFILNNSLHKFIPHSKLFNSQTYAEYESEFSMYCRMSLNELVK